MDDLDFGATIRGFSAGQKLFGRYTLKNILGRGGMGIVWRARDESLERDVALKMLPELIAHDPGAVRDLKRETARSQQLSHPHILRIYDFVEGHGVCGISMELVEGGTLAARRQEQPGEVFDVATLTPWVTQLLEALAYAHEREKIVHRDLKPANLMLTSDDRLKIADFGIAASVSDTISRASMTASSSGTPVYMSPQQMMGEKPAVTDDIYAVGATLYELLTGKPPFYTGNVILQAREKIPPSIAERRAELGVTAAPVPPAWEAALAACLTKDPAHRPQSATALLGRLVAADTKPPPVDQHSSPPAAPAPTTSPKLRKPGIPRLVLYTGLCLAVCGLAAYYWLRYLPSQQPGWETRQEMLKLIGTLPLNAVDVHIDEVTHSVEYSHPELGEFAPGVMAALDHRIAQIKKSRDNDPNARVGYYGDRTKLYAAAAEGSTATVRALLAQEADPNLVSNLYLPDSGGLDGTTGSGPVYPLAAALAAGRGDIVELLLGRGARWDLLNDSYPFHRALPSAVRSKQVALVELVLAQQPPLEPEALRLAAEQGGAEIMQRLLAAGYSPHHRFSGEINQHGFLTHYTRTVLHLAAVAPEVGALRVLLQAIRPTNTQIVDMMDDSPAIQQAIHMHPRTEEGETPLHWAVRDGSVEAITLLRQAMASPETTCLAGRKPADLATGADREQRLRALQGR